MITEKNEEMLDNLELDIFEAGNTAKALSLIIGNAYALSIDNVFAVGLSNANTNNEKEVIRYKDDTETMLEYLAQSLTSLQDTLYRLSNDISDRS